MITKLTNFVLEANDSKTAIIKLFNMFKSINDDCRVSGESVVPFSDIEYYTDQIENIYHIKRHQAERLAQKLAKHAEESNVNEHYDMDFENGDISEEYAKAIIDEAINSHKMSGIFNIKVLFDKFCTENDLPKFESRREMVYNSLVDILSTMLHDVKSMNESLNESIDIKSWAKNIAYNSKNSGGDTTYSQLIDFCKENNINLSSLDKIYQELKYQDFTKQKEVMILLNRLIGTISEARNYQSLRGWAILPAGKINLTTGDTDYFNVIENLDGGEGTLVLVKKNETYMVISSSGKMSDIKAGEYQEGYHDQNPNRKYHLKIQDSFPTNLASLKKIKDIVGKNSVSFAVFK